MDRHQLELAVSAVRTELSWDSCFFQEQETSTKFQGEGSLFHGPKYPCILSCLNAYFALKNMFVSLCLMRWGQIGGVYTQCHAVTPPLLSYQKWSQIPLHKMKSPGAR